MYYVCVEDNQIINMLSYEPNVPESVIVHSITEEEYNNILADTHYFDLITNRVELVSNEEIQRKTQAFQNGQEREFLNSTDWKVLRHIRQKHLGIATTLTEEQYTELENQREAAAQRVVDIE